VVLTKRTFDEQRQKLVNKAWNIKFVGYGLSQIDTSLRGARYTDQRRGRSLVKSKEEMTFDDDDSSDKEQSQPQHPVQPPIEGPAQRADESKDDVFATIVLV
jgi:hypothetical protein